MENKNLKIALDNLGVEYVKELTKLIIQNRKDSSGDLIDSLDYRSLQVVDGVILEILANNTLQYVDKGRRPNSKQPPIKAIIPWVQKENIKIKGIKTVEQTAFVIAKSIAKKGIAPTNIIDKAKQNVMNNTSKLIQKAAMEDIELMLNEILNK